jgi:hypothetical protein
VAVAAPNEAHRAKCVQHQAELEAAIAKVVGAPVKVVVVVDRAAAHDDGPDDASAAAPASAAVSGPAGGGNVVALPTPAVVEEEIDLDELTDVPAEAVVSPFERLTTAFPGSQLVDE